MPKSSATEGDCQTLPCRVLLSGGERGVRSLPRMAAQNLTHDEVIRITETLRGRISAANLAITGMLGCLPSDARKRLAAQWKAMEEDFAQEPSADDALPSQAFNAAFDESLVSLASAFAADECEEFHFPFET